MKKIAAMVLAGVLAAVPVSTTGAAEFQDGASSRHTGQRPPEEGLQGFPECSQNDACNPRK